MIYAKAAKNVEAKRKAFLQKWRLRCKARCWPTGDQPAQGRRLAEHLLVAYINANVTITVINIQIEMSGRSADGAAGGAHRIRLAGRSYPREGNDFGQHVASSFTHAGISVQATSL